MGKASMQAFILVIIAFLIIGGLISIENSEEEIFALSDEQIANLNNKEIEKLSLNIMYDEGNVFTEYYLRDGKVQVAKYLNDFENIDYEGLDAFKFINRNLLSLNFKTPESVLVDMILNDLHLSNNFNKFHLRVEYFNGDLIDIDTMEY